MTRSVLVTGASKGIGAAIAATLGGQGFTIVVHYRSDGAGAERTAEAVRAAGGDCRLIQFDVTDRPGCRSAIEADIAAHGAYYGVVNNAGVHRDNAFPLLTDEDWDEVVRTDLDGFYNVLQAVRHADDPGAPRRSDRDAVVGVGRARQSRPGQL